MTTEPMETSPFASDDPLARLRRRIAQARRAHADRPPTGRPARNEDDPLERLRRRIDEASDPSTLLDSVPPPLDELLEAFDHAEALLDQPIGYLREAEGGPLERMRRQLEREADAIGRRRAIPLPRSTTSSETPRPPTDTGDGTAAVGRELLRMLAGRDLPGSTRAEAVRRLATAIEDGDRAELRRVLRLLIQG